jgi:hypothetical protein
LPVLVSLQINGSDHYFSQAVIGDICSLGCEISERIEKESKNMHFAIAPVLNNVIKAVLILSLKKQR